MESTGAPPRPSAAPRILFILALGIAGGGVLLFLLMPACIVEGTLIDTPAGPRPIETLEAGDAVWTEGPSGDREPGRIRSRTGGWAASSLEIVTTSGAALNATSSHPISTPGGWRTARSLSSGDAVRVPGGWTTVVSISRRSAWTRVYDLEVEPNSNFFASGVLVHNKSSQMVSNERNARHALSTLVIAQEDFRDNDRDNNKVNDFWVGDVAGLYFLKTGGEAIKLIELSLAEADAAPRTPGTANPKAGYLYAVIPERSDGKPLGPSEFAVCAWPVNVGSGGRFTYIVNQDRIVWKSERKPAGRILRWPKDPAAEGWSRED